MFPSVIPGRFYGTMPPFGIRPVKGQVHVVVNRSLLLLLPIGFFLQIIIIITIIINTKIDFLADEHYIRHYVDDTLHTTITDTMLITSSRHYYRHFVEYILHNETAHALLNWTRSTHVPDETFFVTLNYNPKLGIRGSFRG